MSTLADGPLHDRRGPYVRDAMEIAPDVFLVVSQRGTKGSGRVWNPAIVTKGANPHRDWSVVAEVKDGQGYAAQDRPHKLSIYQEQRRGEIFFADKQDAVQFMTRIFQ